MNKRFYPAVLERGPKATFGAWFPDFPGCVAGGKSQDEIIEKAESLLAQAVDALAEHSKSLPEPTPIERIALPRGCNPVAFFMVGVAPPRSIGAGERLPAEELDKSGRQARGGARHESLELLRARGQQCPYLVPKSYLSDGFAAGALRAT